MRTDQNQEQQNQLYPELGSWHQERADYSLHIPGERETSRVWVQAAIPFEGNERPKLILEDHNGNLGKSLESDSVKTAVIEQLSGEMKYQANELDWYFRDENGKVQSIDVTQQQETREHPTYSEIKQSGDLNHNDLQDARNRFFPDQTVNVLKAQSSEVPMDQLAALDKAFNGRTNDSLNEVSRSRSDSSQTADRGQIDLSQESFQPREQTIQPQEQEIHRQR